MTAKEHTARLKKYGLSHAQWMRMFDRQGGKCPICQKEIFKPGNREGKKAAAVDHDHRTKRVRGLLDYRCNRFIIGRNTAERAVRVADYLTSTFDGRDI